GIRHRNVTGVQTCALPVWASSTLVESGLTEVKYRWTSPPAAVTEPARNPVSSPSGANGSSHSNQSNGASSENVCPHRDGDFGSARYWKNRCYVLPSSRSEE